MNEITKQAEEAATAKQLTGQLLWDELPNENTVEEVSEIVNKIDGFYTSLHSAELERVRKERDGFAIWLVMDLSKALGHILIEKSVRENIATHYDKFKNQKNEAGTKGEDIRDNK